MHHESRFMAVLAAVFLLVFSLFWLWQNPGLVRGRLSQAEIDRAMAYIEKNIALPPDEKAPSLERFRKWAEADDGRPVYMLNLMRYYDTVRPLPGSPAFKGTPHEANALYESKAMPLLLASGNYPVFGSETQGQNVLTDKTIGDGLGRILVVRYASRRDFITLITNPAYAPIEPYKLMALQVALTPTSGDFVIPDARLALGALLLIAFLAIGWVRSARRRASIVSVLGLAPAIPAQRAQKVKETL